MILNGTFFMIFGTGTLYMIGYVPGAAPEPLYRVFEVYNVTLALVGAVLFVSGVAARVYRGVRDRAGARKWR